MNTYRVTVGERDFIVVAFPLDAWDMIQASLLTKKLIELLKQGESLQITVTRIK